MPPTQIVEPFDDTLRQLLTGLFGRLMPWHGYSNKAIESALSKSKQPLPLILQHCYRIAGKHPALTTGLQNLLSIDSFVTRSFTEGDGLIFLSERQRVSFTVIQKSNLEVDDPPVHQGNDEEQVLYPDCRYLSHFLLLTVAWNAIELLPHSCKTRVNALQLEKIAESMQRVDCGTFDETYDLSAYWRKGFVVCVFPDKDSGTEYYDVYAAATSRQAMRRFEKVHELTLDWL